MRRPPPAARRFESSEMFHCGITSGRAHPFEFLWSYVHLQAPACHVWTFPREDRIQRKIGRSENPPQSCQLRFGRDAVQLKQVTEAAYDGSDAQTQGVIDELGRV